jgi:hypothetical protein
MKHDSTFLHVLKPSRSNKDWNLHLWLEAACFVTSHATNLRNTRNLWHNGRQPSASQAEPRPLKCNMPSRQ